MTLMLFPPRPEMRLVHTSLCIITLSLVMQRVTPDCLMFGMCNENQYCLVNKPPQRVSGDSLNQICGLNDILQCCDQEQLDSLQTNLELLSLLVNSVFGEPNSDRCYNGLRQILCEMTCSPRQSEMATVTGHNESDGAVTAIDYHLPRRQTQVTFDECAALDGIFGKPVNMICGSDDCDMETFFRKFGLSTANGGRSPFNINFVFTDDAVNESTRRPLSTPPPKNESDKVASHAFPGNPTMEVTAFPQLVLGRPMWLAMLLTFLGLTLVFLVSLAIRWCIAHQWEDSGNVAAGSYSPPIGCYSKIGATIQFGSAWLFERQGALVARHPYMVLLLTAVVMAVAFCGFVRFRVTTDPVELWSDPNSRARLEKAYFDEHFGPFHRTEQIIVRPLNLTPTVWKGEELGAVFDKAFLKSVLDLQTKVTRVRAYSEAVGREVKLGDICYKPLEPASTECGVFSPLEYFQSNGTLLDAVIEGKDYLDHLKFCSKTALSDEGPLSGCRGSAGAPMFANLVFGGVEGEDYMQSTAVVITILVKNAVDHNSQTVLMAKAWESEFIRTVLNWRTAHPELVVSFAAERSMEDEIDRQSHSDISTIIISYAVMVLYVSICLGNYRGFRTCLVDVKISLSIGGVLIVLASVFSSIGLWSFVGVAATLIIIEVIPFLVLAVGVDNIFIMVQDFLMHEHEGLDEEDENGGFESQESLANVDDGAGESGGDCVGKEVGCCVIGKGRQRRRRCAGASIAKDAKKHPNAGTVEVRIAKTMGRVGPSMLLSSLAESIAFFCGAMTNMPAVRVFALYAGVAIVINFLLQIFAFTALLTLDAKRSEANLFDFCCCVEVVTPSESFTDEDDSMPEPANLEKRRKKKRKSDKPWLYRFVAHILAPFILSKWIRVFLFIIFLGWVCFCAFIIPGGIKIGLDQKLSMSLDSYVLEYFDAISELLEVGPPVYFVVTKGHDFDSLQGQNQLCFGDGCDVDSLVRTLNQKIVEKNHLLSFPLMSWVDTYAQWSNIPSCCGISVSGTEGNFTFCQSTREKKCDRCPQVNKRLLGDSFNQLLPFFLNRVPDAECPYGGRAQFGSAVYLASPSSHGNASRDEQHPRVVTSYFSAHHTVLRTTEDFIEAIKKAREISDIFGPRWANTPVEGGTKTVQSAQKAISRWCGPQPNSVFAYSIFYVFYEQYLNIVRETIVQVSMGLAVVSLITWVMLGLDVVATLNVVVGVASITLSVAATMVLWNISLNAISLVNLVVCIGISVEFCAHIVRSFTISTKATRVERALDALSEMGSSVLRGITLTKFGGIVVLGFAKSRLFQVFYFRMYLSMVLFGAAVGIIFLPVQLSFFGPQLNRAMLYKQKRPAGGGIRRDSRRGRCHA